MKQRIRPLSPHLTVYKPQATSLLSIFHRVAGSLLGFIMITFFFVFNSRLVFIGYSFPYCFYFDFFSVIPVALVSHFFLCVIVMFFYHVTNGVRHLFWDLALGLDIKNLHTSGLLVLVFCIIIRAIISV